MHRCAKVSGNQQCPLTTSGEVGGANSSGGVARKPPQPITLFSTGHTRAEVAVHVMLRSQDILEGFDLAQSIIMVGHTHTLTHTHTHTHSHTRPLQTYQLPPSNILSETSRGLAGDHRHGDIRVLLDCVCKSSFASDSLNDDILMAAIKVLASHSEEVCIHDCRLTFYRITVCRHCVCHTSH